MRGRGEGANGMNNTLTRAVFAFPRRANWDEIGLSCKIPGRASWKTGSRRIEPDRGIGLRLATLGVGGH